MQPKLNVLDLFAGIGGFSLGLERTGGFRTAAFCEQDKACQRVLAKHWPDVPIFDDVRTLTKDSINERIDVITGGFPCQDISNAGTKQGLAGARSGLWFEFHRLIQEFRPAWVIIENVSALRTRGLDAVLGSLAEIGYDAQWHCIPAAALGAPHQRDRIWIIAYPDPDFLGRDGGRDHRQGRSLHVHEERHHSAPLSDGEQPQPNVGAMGAVLADAGGEGLQRSEWLRDDLTEALRRWESDARPASQRCPVSGGETYSWDAEPDVGRVAHGVPGRVDRLKQLGNAVVPQLPQLIGEAILQFHK